MEFLITVDVFFYISPQTENLLSKEISKTKFSNQLDIIANKMIDFWYKLPIQIKNRNSVKKIKIR